MKSMQKSVVIALFVCVIASPPCSGFPGPPLSLVDRWTKSSIVALVDVTSTGELEVDNHPPRSTRRSLRSANS